MPTSAYSGASRSYAGSKRKAGSKRTGPKYSKKRRTTASFATSLSRKISRVLNRNLETKQSIVTSTDNLAILHNSFGLMNGGNLLATTQGVTDPGSTNTANRIGDKITLQRVTMKMMLELDERSSDSTFRIMVVRTARGDVPTSVTLFKGQSNNKMLDEFDSERFTCLAQKWVKLTSRNVSATVSTDPAYAGGFLGPLTAVGTAGTIAAYPQYTMSRATKLVSISVPGSKFSKNGIIQYESGTSSVKFFDYYVVIYGYNNFGGVTGTTQVGRINDFISRMYFKDG